MNNSSMKPFNKFKLKETDNKSEDNISNDSNEQSIGKYNEKDDTKLNANISSDKITEPSNLSITNKQLQEAVIWSEILGKPLCKRRKRR